MSRRAARSPLTMARSLLSHRWQRFLRLASSPQINVRKCPSSNDTNSRRLYLEQLSDRTLLAVGSPIVPISPPIAYDAVLTLDIEQDGVAEVLAHMDRTGSWWLLNSDGSVASQEPIASWPAQGQFENIELLDLDGDSRSEIVGRSAATGEWWSITFDGNGATSTQIASWEVEERYERILTGSFLADGSDAIVGYSAENASFQTLALDAGVAESFTTAAPPGLANPSIFVVGDTDGDGQDEVLVRAEDGAWWRGIVGSSGLEITKIAGWSTLHEFTAIRIADIDGDGKDEIVGRNTTGTWWGVFNNNGTYSNHKLNSWSTSGSYSSIMTLDVDGTGTEWIVGRHVATGRWWALAHESGVWRNRALPIWSTTSSYSNLQVVDINGDGGQEIVGRQTSTGTWWALDPSGFRNIAMASWNPGTPLSHFVVANLNDDSKVDFLAFAAETGVFWTIQSTGTGYRHERLASWNPDWRDLSYQSSVVGTDTDLVNLIRRQVPGLTGSMSARGLDALELLRDWVANATSYALDSQTATETNNGIDARTAADLYYRTFLPNLGGVYCGGMAVFASKVYRLFGFAAFTVDIGQLMDSLTHVTVVVSLPIGGTLQHYIFDPTFNASFKRANGEYATVNDLLSAAINGQDLDYHDKPMDLRDFVSAAPNNSFNLFLQPGTRLYVYKMPSYSIQTFLDGFQPFLDQSGYRVEPIVLGELMRTRVFSIETNDQTGARASLINVFRAFGVPIGFP